MMTIQNVEQPLRVGTQAVKFLPTNYGWLVANSHGLWSTLFFLQVAAMLDGRERLLSTSSCQLERGTSKSILAVLICRVTAVKWWIWGK